MAAPVTNYPSLNLTAISDIRLRSKKKTKNEIADNFAEIPENTRLEFALKLYSLSALVWEYAETILDICAAQRISDTKPLVRKIRELRSEYDKFRWSHLGKDEVHRELERALELEEVMDDNFSKLSISLFNEISKKKLTEGHRLLLIAVQQAMTVIDALFMYSAKVDKMLEESGLPYMRDCLVQTEIIQLRSLIPQFGGDCYCTDIPARKITAKLIYNTLDSIQIFKDNNR